MIQNHRRKQVKERKVFDLHCLYSAWSAFWRDRFACNSNVTCTVRDVQSVPEVFLARFPVSVMSSSSFSPLVSVRTTREKTSVTQGIRDAERVNKVDADT